MTEHRECTRARLVPRQQGREGGRPTRRPPPPPAPRKPPDACHCQVPAAARRPAGLQRDLFCPPGAPPAGAVANAAHTRVWSPRQPNPPCGHPGPQQTMQDFPTGGAPQRNTTGGGACRAAPRRRPWQLPPARGGVACNGLRASGAAAVAAVAAVGRRRRPPWQQHLQARRPISSPQRLCGHALG